MNSKYDTEDYKLTADVRWIRITKKVECEYCGGTGKTSGGFHSLDEEESCPACMGSGKNYPKDKRGMFPPKMPEELIKELSGVWQKHNETK